MSDDAILREKAREAVRNGTLPTSKPSHLLGGPARSGDTCALCGEPLTQGQAELEVEFDGASKSDRNCFHPRCFAAWELECTKIDGPSEPPRRST